MSGRGVKVQLRTRALMVVASLMILLFLVMYVIGLVLIVNGSGDLRQRVTSFLVASMAIGLAAALAAVFLIERMGIAQVDTMADAMRRIREGDDLTVRVPVAGNDEVSQLAVTINRTLDTLAVSRQQLEASEQRFRSLVESINDVVWEVDGGLRFTYVSSKVRDVMGCDPAELAGKTPFEFLRDGERERLVPLIRGQIDAAGSFSPVDFAAIRRDGSAVDLEISGAPIRDGAGNVAGYRGVARDISERKRTGEALKKAYDDLELRVQQRTAELKEANDSLETNVQQRTAELASAVSALQAEIAERRKVEGQMLSSLQEKEVLLKEIHHRVKNNLQIISSLLSLQSGTSSQDPARTFRDSQDRIRSMALIHEKLYQARDISRVDFAEYVRSLTAYLARSYMTGRRAEIVADIQDITLDIDHAIPCGLIINELVSNSLKYAFRDGRHGVIHISLIRDGEQYVMTVGDNGVGLPPGLDFRDTPSLGLQLVNTLVSQLEGSIRRLDGEGTAFQIAFAE